MRPGDPPGGVQLDREQKLAGRPAAKGLKGGSETFGERLAARFGVVRDRPVRATFNK
jgi:hypothetical protein